MKRNKQIVERLRDKLVTRYQVLNDLLDRKPIQSHRSPTEEDEEVEMRNLEVYINSSEVRIAVDDLTSVLKEIRKL